MTIIPSVPERYDLLEDALCLLPILWGPGTKPFQGKVLDVPEASTWQAWSTGFDRGGRVPRASRSP
ncbi:hypothetical protein AB0C18_05350 [Nonomuraea muscovyensis]|jgi:hypothetical protein|uniref:Uncharacterized protein n=1 Tax=Nonomuraea muscovyensis TaxID=1124761 RepID=A0A7X0CCF2_9ACTN|nr:hypothetical protein [Nonomuraea muscovyensis]MBB6351191.1 hypothetical protein [Nonomuraea muscovyensis]MDF2705265.1 Luciferase-like monooxygenase [Nonomuraea muscovyensis]